MELTPAMQEAIGWIVGVIAILAGVTASAVVLIRGLVPVFTHLDGQ